MSMSVPGDSGEDEVMASINTTPLVDVMLVMLIIFLITIPVIIPTVKVDMPTPRNIAVQDKVEDISLSVDSSGKVYWNGGYVPDRTKLLDLLVSEARKVPQPEIHIKGDRNARYEYVGRVLFVIQQSGMQKVGFMSEPKAVVQ
jgi:biopolymer transport protein ExbD